MPVRRGSGLLLQVEVEVEVEVELEVESVRRDWNGDGWLSKRHVIGCVSV